MKLFYVMYCYRWHGWTRFEILEKRPTFSSFLIPCLKKSPKYCYGQCFPIKFVLCLLLKYTQGYPMTVFCQISVRRSKNCLEFSIAWGRIKISRWPFHSCTIFKAYLINSLRFSQSPVTPQVKLFFLVKGNLKFSEPKMRCREESEKLSFS